MLGLTHTLRLGSWEVGFLIVWRGGWVGRKNGKVLMSGGGGGREPWVGVSQRRTSRTTRVMLCLSLWLMWREDPPTSLQSA